MESSGGNISHKKQVITNIECHKGKVVKAYNGRRCVIVVGVVREGLSEERHLST